MGKRPKTWIEKRRSMNTDVVDGRRDARTTEAVKAVVVERDVGSLL